MLQQTPVERVTPVWSGWVARWPQPADLAAAPPAEAIRAWGRLGYPRRALRLHECARLLRDRYAGRVPRNLPDLLALPGVGPYTARAVAAFAFRQRHPVVDTNVRRLVARYAGGRPDAGPVTTAADLQATEALLPRLAEAAATASAAFMELGATVCTARAPRCGSCPLAAGCAWRARGVPLPGGPSRRPQRDVGPHPPRPGPPPAPLRDATGPVTADRLARAWPDARQRQRALQTLTADGLVCQAVGDQYVLPGAVTPAAVTP